VITIQPRVMTGSNTCAKLASMAAKQAASAVTHLGKTMKKDRVARGWTLRELARQTGINYTTLSLVENGHRPPTERIAVACDRVFPERNGWYLDYYEDSKSWMPAGFRNWPEYEDKASSLHVWSPGVVDGLVQVEGYARAILETLPGVTDEIIAARLANRMKRQQRVLYRDDPPAVRVIIDELCLFRRVGSVDVMSEQLAHVAEIAALPHVTLQVLPARAHPATASSFMVTDTAGYVEHVLGGGTHTDALSVNALAILFDALRSECYGASESLALVGKARKLWTGEHLRSQARKADSA
jgi:lambda repressor-like predicted transcriptional regulator